MIYQMLNTCPVCNNHLYVTKLQCKHCNTTIENEFKPSGFASLSEAQMDFVETFIVSRGNIKEVEKELGISYPTVRGRLNEIIEKLRPEQEQKVSKESVSAYTKDQVISMLENGEITSSEAVKLLKE